MRIRPAREGDETALVALARAFATASPSAAASAEQDLVRLERTVGAVVSSPLSQVIVAEVGRAVVAVMVLAWCQSLIHAGRTLVYLDLLVVSEQHRRKGIATAMLEHAAAIAQEKGAYKLFLITGTENEAANALYRECGFSVNGIAYARYL